MDFDITKLAEILKSNNIDVSGLKDAANKEIETNCIWHDSNEGYNTDIMTRDGFIGNLYAEGSKNALSKEQLGTLYDIVSAIDGEEGMTGEELKILSNINGNGNYV